MLSGKDKMGMEGVGSFFADVLLLLSLCVVCTQACTGIVLIVTGRVVERSAQTGGKAIFSVGKQSVSDCIPLNLFPLSRQFQLACCARVLIVG